MQAHQHEQNCLQIDPAMNRTIYSTPKLSWASDHERKFNLHKVLQLNFFFSSTGRRPPDRTGLSESEVTRLFNSNQEIFQWMLARYRFSNSRCALSDSSHLHLKPHVRFFTRDWFFSCIHLPDAAPWNVCIDAACFTFCFLIKVSPASSIVDWLGWYWINWDW